MPGPCPEGFATQDAHDQARCQDRGNCTGPGCRLRRAKRTAWASAELDAEVTD